MANRTVLVNFLRSAKRAGQTLAARAASSQTEDYAAVVDLLDGALDRLGENTSSHIATNATVRQIAPAASGARFGSTPPNLIVSPELAAAVEKKTADSAEVIPPIVPAVPSTPVSDPLLAEVVGGVVTAAADAGQPLTEAAADAAAARAAEPATGSPATPAEVDASAAAEREAKEAGLDLAAVEGSGEDGRVLVDDVRSAAEAQAEADKLEAAAAVGQITELAKDDTIVKEIAGSTNKALLARYGNIETIQALTTQLGGTADATKSENQQAALLKKAAQASLEAK